LAPPFLPFFPFAPLPFFPFPSSSSLNGSLFLPSDATAFLFNFPAFPFLGFPRAKRSISSSSSSSSSYFALT
jgi:hypothetical protein